MKGRLLEVWVVSVTVFVSDAAKPTVLGSVKTSEKLTEANAFPDTVPLK